MMFRRVAAFALHTHYEYYVSRHTLSPLVIVYMHSSVLHMHASRSSRV